ncbi:hypothetical protein Pelo_3299 [Pelomyxa schiedti]|nr:hypothetical protein Pelo_3299 [Pelomyxa schiedti]
MKSEQPPLGSALDQKGTEANTVGCDDKFTLATSLNVAVPTFSCSSALLSSPSSETELMTHGALLPSVVTTTEVSDPMPTTFISGQPVFNTSEFMPSRRPMWKLSVPKTSCNRPVAVWKSTRKTVSTKKDCPEPKLTNKEVLKSASFIPAIPPTKRDASEQDFSSMKGQKVVINGKLYHIMVLFSLQIMFHIDKNFIIMELQSP